MPISLPNLRKKSSSGSVRSVPPTPVEDQPMPPKVGTLETLAMLKKMGYRDVWCHIAEVSQDIIAEALAEGWIISDAQKGRVRFTRHEQDAMWKGKGRLSTHSRSDSHDSHTTQASQANSYHTIGHRSDESSGRVSTVSSKSSRYSQESAAPRGHHRHSSSGSAAPGERPQQLSPTSPRFNWQPLRSPSPLNPAYRTLRSPGGVSPSAGLSGRNTPDLRVHSPEGVVRPPSFGPVDSYFDYLPHPPKRLSDLPEGDERSSSTPTTMARSRPTTTTTEPEDIVEPLFKHSPDPEGGRDMDLEQLASWVPDAQTLRSSTSLFTFDRPRPPSSTDSPLELGRRTPYDVDEDSFEFDSPGFEAMFARPTPELRMPPSRKNTGSPSVPESIHLDEGAQERVATTSPPVAPQEGTSSRNELPLLSPRWQCRDT